VPREVLPEMVRQVTEIGRRQELIIGVLLHAGDGNLHPQIVFNPRDTEQLARVRRAQEEIVRAALSLGGAMTGEHGVGSEKRHFMNLVFGPGELALMAGIKRAFDPRGLMNPGKLLPDETPEEAERPAVPEGTFEQVAPEITVRDEQGRWRPRDYEAVSKFLALANRDGRPVRIMGAGIGLDLRSPLPTGQAEPEREVLCTLSLGRLLHLEAANLTVTVQAGMRLGELQQALAEAGQWWPVIPPGGAEATIGGILAGGMSGPLAARYGRLQDLVTGVKFALPSGEVLRFGLPCVKNVAGYAVERLMVGSRGTLGALLELTLRTLPLPERRQTVRVTGGDLETFRVRLQANGTRPAAVESQGEGLLVALQGMESEVEALEETVAALASETGAEPQPAEEELWTLVAAGRRERLAPPPPGAEEFSRRLKELFDPRGILPGP
jgi:D-lactate dehydrogenase (cytochrome)